MLLEMYENLPELSAEQLVIQSSLKSSISLAQTIMCKKPNIKCSLEPSVGFFCTQQELSKSKFNLIMFKGNNKSKSLLKRVFQVVSCQLFQRNSYKK